MPNLIWFREDLRIHDNTALHHAARNAKNGLVAVYVLSTEDWESHDTSACRVDFILRNLQELSRNLATLNIPLLIPQAKTSKQIPKLVLEICQQYKIDTVYYNKQYELDEARRDLATDELLRQNDIKVFSYTDQVILAPGEVLTKDEHFYTVFTPFKKSWYKKFWEQTLIISPKPAKQIQLSIVSDTIPEKIPNFISTIPKNLWPAGEKEAQQRLKNFMQNKITQYDKERDFPAIDGTSMLSPYLASGIISPRQCLQAALEINKNKLETGNQGVTTWISELIWREFYKHILYAFPRVSMYKPFKLETENLIWNNDTELFNAWKEGKTGYPIVDAAMRQLNQTGWMHNRLRMVVAMFLVKDLWIDWRWGEKYFMQQLIDGDLAANNGGWQWAASTGTDAVPYFRIFNPLSQSERFDPEGKFIRQYCPELSKLDNKEIHNPSSLLRKNLGYPEPIVDHNKARQNALQAFKNLK